MVRSFFNSILTLLRPWNLGILLFIMINSSLIIIPILYITGTHCNAIIAIPLALLGYVIYIVLIYLVGELIIRLMFGSNRIILNGDIADNQIGSAFAEAYVEAKRIDPNLSDNIHLYMCDVNYPDAYAFGRTTILVSDSASQMPQNELKILLLEKFAQISNYDSDRYLFLIAGNFLFVVMIFIAKILVYIIVAMTWLAFGIVRFILGLFFNRVPSGGFGILSLSAYLNVCSLLSNALESVLLFFLNLSLRLVLVLSRRNVFDNDVFVCRCGYYNELKYYLQYREPDVRGLQSTLGTISAAKPSRLARISRLQPINIVRDNNGIGARIEVPVDEQLIEESDDNLVEKNPRFRVVSKEQIHSKKEIRGFTVIDRSRNQDN